MRSDYRIPVIERSVYAGSYHSIPVDRDHALYQEPLVLLSDYQVAAQGYHARTDGQNPPYHQPVFGSRADVWIRRTVARMLQQVNELLLPYGREIFVLDGYRPIDCQRGLWDFYLGEAKRKRPNASLAEQEHDAKQHVADPTHFSPTDSRTWPAHSNGGAVDVTLRYLSGGTLVEMGSQFEEITPSSQNFYFEQLLAQGKVSANDIRLTNRRLLHWAMHEVGFINDPFVFWHYDWGNQLYVKCARKLFGIPVDQAWYGYIADP